ncbi:SIS domain-containing protein [Frankia sp. QA3]|uniref:SIS domain-containing protein n=1 Tax=Frankia sp. QA3 TaxID=710111 RepID=UPI000269C578|nr:SIS domain-containing protein [Frankia sp. QA3]EIV93954.1 putative sugar phosphate isomerase involved in capsule formation [Frankia sp. QA3]
MYLDEAILDDTRRIDTGNAAALLPHIASAALQVRQSAVLAQEAGVARLGVDGRPRAVLVAGVGGSALAAGILAAVAGPASPVPVIGHHTHGLPGWVGVSDMVLAVSASGTSAETCSVVEEAARRGARIAVVAPADTPLAHLADLAGAPFVPLTGQRPARTTLWSLAVPLLVAARALGIVRLADDAVEAAAARLEDVATRCRSSSESFVNPAKTLALQLAGTLPLIWGTSPVTSVAAERAASQLATNAKYPAVVGALPHPGHHQVALLDGPFGAGLDTGGTSGQDELEDFFRDRVEEEQSIRLRLVLLRDPDAERPEVSRQAEAAVAVAVERGVGVTELRAEGAGPLERLASLIGLFDFTAVYTALALGIDPSQVPAVRDLGR